MFEERHVAQSYFLIKGFYYKHKLLRDIMVDYITTKKLLTGKNMRDFLEI